MTDLTDLAAEALRLNGYGDFGFAGRLHIAGIVLDATREASIAPYVETLEWISDQISLACQSDCENGVRWLNEKAATNYLKDAPAMKEAIAAIQTKIDALLWNG